MEKKSKRDRGRIITTSGLKKLNEAIEEWKQQYNLRGTLAEIEAESGVGSDTISKIRQGRVGADLSKIQQLFAAFGLTLDETDYRSGKQSSSQTESEPIAQLLPLLKIQLQPPLKRQQQPLSQTQLLIQSLRINVMIVSI